MFRGWLTLNDLEVVNTTRTITYARNGVLNPTAQVVTDESWAMLPRWLGHEDGYQLPEWDDSCPWFDRFNSASAEFAGIWPMSVKGLDSTPLAVDVVESATDGGAVSTTRVPPRTVSFEALVIGATPAGLRFGMEWLGSVLRRPNQTMHFLESAPLFDARQDVDDVHRLADAELRMVAGVDQTEPITVEESFSPAAREGYQATIARVSWEMVATVPWVWRQPVYLAGGLRPHSGQGRTVSFENVGASGACPTGCASDLPVLVDPSSPALTQLPRPLSPSAAAGCMPIESKRLVWRLDPGRLPRGVESLPTVTVKAGERDERHLRIQWVHGNHPGAGVSLGCDTVGEAMVSYLPAGATLRLDAVTGKAQAVTKDGSVVDATPVVTGRWGGPWRAPILDGAETYTLFIDAEKNVSSGVEVSISAVVRQP